MLKENKKKKAYSDTKPHLNIGTLGHVDHGKTTLTSAITAFCHLENPENESLSYEDIDNAPEEKARGITISARVVDYQTETRHYGHVDCPGHADYVKNMITGASQLDGAILVVDGFDGPKAQTLEHLILARRLGIKNLVIFVNKIDLVVEDEEALEFTLLDLKQKLEEYSYGNEPIVLGSARTALAEISGNKTFTEYGALAIKKLLDTVDSHFPTPARDIDKPAFLAIEHVYSIPGRGTVITGTIQTGKLTPGTYDLLGQKSNHQARKIVVKEIEMFHQTMKEAKAGDNVGVLVNLDKNELTRGECVAGIGSRSAHKSFEAELYILLPEEGGRASFFESGYKPQFFINTADITGEIVLEDKEMKVMPGDNISVSINMDEFICLKEGQSVSFREGNRTIGTGRVTKLL